MASLERCQAGRGVFFGSGALVCVASVAEDCEESLAAATSLGCFTATFNRKLQMLRFWIMVHVGLSELFGEQLPLNLMVKNLITPHFQTQLHKSWDDPEFF